MHEVLRANNTFLCSYGMYTTVSMYVVLSYSVKTTETPYFRIVGGNTMVMKVHGRLKCYLSVDQGGNISQSSAIYLRVNGSNRVYKGCTTDRHNQTLYDAGDVKPGDSVTVYTYNGDTYAHEFRIVLFLG